MKSHGWKLIFDSFNVKSINKSEFTLNFVANFLNEFKECNSKHKKYKFQMDVEIQQENKELELIKYEASDRMKTILADLFYYCGCITADCYANSIF